MTRSSDLRALAIAHSLFPQTTLTEAVARLGFVQADPIRAPARAQDLILRQRVEGYRVGDLQRSYAELELEEGMLYAYGFMPRDTWFCLHPRRSLPRLRKLEREVLAAVPELAPAHPKQLTARFGSKRVRNAWGGTSQATKRALEALHRRGALRVVGRRQGVRLYGPAPPVPPVPARQRLRELARRVLHVFAPARRAYVRGILGRLGRALLDAQAGRAALAELVQSGEWREATVEGEVYLLPAEAPSPKAPPRVRVLAPFDPLVHDRARFEHLWGWAYRFEAYTPAAKRVRGYYAMPLLWRDRVVGWVNASQATGAFEAEIGYVRSPPRSAPFRRALAAELEQLEAFLRPR